jgi:hypothetical protein
MESVLVNETGRNQHNLMESVLVNETRRNPTETNTNLIHRFPVPGCVGYRKT